MTAIDIGIVALALLFGLSGLRAGFLVGSATVGGLTIGAIIGSKLGPVLLTDGSESPYAALSALAGGLVIGGIVAIMVEGVASGLRERAGVAGVSARIDAGAGALLMGALGLGLAWLGGVVALNTPGLEDARQAVQRSAILGDLYERFPPSESLISVLNEVDPSPSVEGRDIDIAAPPKGIVNDPALDRFAASVVRVRGNACGLGVAGSGWIASPGLVVTNAHVVAGQTDTSVTDQGGSTYSATPVIYKPKKDLAVLRVDGIDGPPLNLAQSPESGLPAAVLGFPKNGPYTVSAARFGRVSKILAPDSYGDDRILRRIAIFRGKVVSGNSGGPLVNRRGLVLGTVFASAVGTQRPQGFAVPNIAVRNSLNRVGDEVDTGPCS